MSTVNISDLCVGILSSIRQAAACIDRNARGIALLVDEEQRLIRTITDGDIRRAILAGISLDASVNELRARRPDSSSAKAVTARKGTARSELLLLMQERGVSQVPLLDDDGRVVDLVTLNELLPEQVLPLQAVIMAGGLGTRLHPLTKDMPKPMLAVGDRPLMERIVEQLRQAGIRRVNITTHYQPEKISRHFGDGRAFGVQLNYVTEDHPLGTAGALGLMETFDEPLLVINGDILTRVDFRAMLSYHREYNADLTVAVRQYDLQVPYGVMECEGALVRHIREKPLFNFLVNAGIYLLEPSVHRFIPNGKRFDMTDLIHRLLMEGRPVVGFPIIEYWLDVGQPADYLQALEDVKNRKLTS